MANRKHLGLSMLSLSLLVGACAPAEQAGVEDTGEDAPLSSLESVLGDAPANETLPEEGKADAVYPATFDLVADQTPVRNQASRGVCSIFATVALMENLYMREGSIPNPDFSEQYLQWSVKSQLGEFSDSGGSNANYNLQAINRFGIPVESAWPYETRPWTSANDPACTDTSKDGLPTICYTNGEPPESATSGLLYKLPAGRYVSSSTRNIKAYMTTNRVGVIASGIFYYQSWNHGRSTLPVNSEYMAQGYVLAPNAEDRAASQANYAGHAFLLVGWDDNLEVQAMDKDGKPAVDANGNAIMQRGFFLFKNSWGTGRFGVKNRFGAGYGWISYDYVSQLSAYSSTVPTAPPVPEVCGDSRDNDRDGKTDCADTDCSAETACMQQAATATTDSSTTRRNIPDGNRTGVSSSITVGTAGTVASVTIHPVITHTYRGDLTLKLVSPNGTTVTVSDKQGGSADNIDEDFTVTGFAGVEAAGEWKLIVIDSARQDTGRIESWSITITRNAQ